MRLWYSEVRYVDTMKTLCSYFNRIHWSKLARQRTRDVWYWSWKYHYVERIWDVIVYSIADKDPLSLMKQIVERENSLY